MKGIYINANLNSMPATDLLSKAHNSVAEFEIQGDSIKVVYDKSEWPEGIRLTIDNHEFVIFGWFVFKGKKNDLTELSESILAQGAEVLSSVVAGSFVLYWHDGVESKVVSDYLSLSTHYIDLYSDKLRVAPAVLPLLDVNKHNVNNNHESILNKVGHLFGNVTVYDGIDRLSPCSVMNCHLNYRYEDISKQLPDTQEKITDVFSQILRLWPLEARMLPLSSGLDSRLILASTTFDKAFTYGPGNSPEVTIASNAAKHIENHKIFDYSSSPNLPQEQQIIDEISFGILKPIPRLLSNYHYIKGVFGQGKVSCDGYLGDVFQRGTFITFKGLLGELFKLFPIVYKFKRFSGLYLLKKRYKVLSEDEFVFVAKDYLEKTNHLELDEYQKVTFYEFLYGRGGRYAYFGGNILCGQFFTVASPFAFKQVFAKFIHQDFADLVSYRGLNSLWKSVPAYLSKLPVESGYKPLTPAFLIPYIQILYRIMFHLIPSRANYGIKLKREMSKKKSKT